MGLLFLIGFGAKLGLLPFYEWFPGAYGSGSGASGAIMSGVVLNAAFFGLSRALFNWLPAAPEGAFPALAVIVIVVATLSAILTILYAFQQDDWRALLSFSSAENASIAVVALGAALMFRTYHLNDLAGLAWIVALLHLAGHALAKGTLFLTADAMKKASGGYHIAYAGAGSHWLLGIGALLAAMSLAAMPPTAGFVSEWFVFQTVFQGFHLPTLGGRLVLALTGAGLALTAAVAFATFVKLIGLGVLSRSPSSRAPIQLALFRLDRPLGTFRAGARRRHAAGGFRLSMARPRRSLGSRRRHRCATACCWFRSLPSSPSSRRACSSSSCRSWRCFRSSSIVASSRRAIRRDARMVRRPLAGSRARLHDRAHVLERDANVLQFRLSPDSRHRARRRRRRILCEEAGVRARRRADLRAAGCFSLPSEP